jgi:hypothetical protein
MPYLGAFVVALRACLLTRRQFLLENAALRQQLIVLRRAVKRPRLSDRDRRFWIVLCWVLPRWRRCLLVVQPETVLRSQRRGWRW